MAVPHPVAGGCRRGVPRGCSRRAPCRRATSSEACRGHEPLHRASLALDVRKRYLRAVMDPGELVITLDGVPARRWPHVPSAEHEALDAEGPSLRRAHARLVSAVDAGAITPLSARVVWRTRVQQDDDAEVAAELGVAVRTLQRRRQRAERELAKAS